MSHLNYKPWYAMAEFIDNSLQSYFDYREVLELVEGPDAKLRVSIEQNLTSDKRIIIRDNAAGIHENDYERAFQPAAVPVDRSGLSEFGMGMKSAACWYAQNWTVRTKALGEPVERTVSFNIESIVRGDVEELRVKSLPAQANKHYTEIVLFNLHKPPQGRTIGKIKEHLASIYREFIRKGTLELSFDGELLSYQEPKILYAPYYKTPSEEPRLWRKEINFDLGLGLSVYGFAAIRETASTSTAGFALFRRDRLIQGSADESYRPVLIFGQPNSFISQRLFGELHLTGFEVSHTKDGFKWDEQEETFLELLKDELNSPPLPLLSQAAEYRVRLKSKELKSGAEVATERTAEVIKHEVPQVLQEQLDTPSESTTPLSTLPPATMLSQRSIDVELDENHWRIILELSDDPSIGDWVDLCDQLVTTEAATDSNVRQVGIRLALAHPFMERFGGTESSQIEPLLRVAVAIVLAEMTARDSGVRQAGAIRRNINELLRVALSKP
ncbi:MAG: ATP-binding protein [Ktedonobacteraceae bacterium]